MLVYIDKKRNNILSSKSKKIRKFSSRKCKQISLAEYNKIIIFMAYS